MTEYKKSVFELVCNFLCCCSCSRRVTRTSDEKRRRDFSLCSVRYCFLSPSTLSTVVDLFFLLSMVWVLYDVAQVMRDGYHTWWWAIPAAFSAPAMLILLLKLRYMRRMCDQAWQEDVVYNARVVLLPLYNAIANTFMISTWLLLSPLYVTEVANRGSGGGDASGLEPAKFTADDYQSAVRDVLTRPSSIILMIVYVISIVCSLFMSALHRRVLIRFIVEAMEEGVDIGTKDTSLLVRDQLHGPASDDPLYSDTGDLRTMRATLRPEQNLDRLYNVPLHVEERDYSGTMQTAEVFTVEDARPGYQDETPPRPPNLKTHTFERKLANEAADRRRDTLSRFDSQREDLLARAPSSPRRTGTPPPAYPAPEPRSGASSPRGTMRRGSSAAAAGNKSDDEGSDRRLDSPRTNARARGHGSGSRSRSNSVSSKRNE